MRGSGMQLPPGRMTYEIKDVQEALYTSSPNIQYSREASSFIQEMNGRFPLCSQNKPALPVHVAGMEFN